MRSVRVHPTVAGLPLLVEEGDPWQAVVIDQLRATSTIVTALAAGAACFVPVRDADEAMRRRDADPGSLAAGERNHAMVAGLDMGNSPREFTSARVAGRRIYFASMNGTRALLAASRFGPVLCASLLNVSAVVRRLLQGDGNVLILCSGTDELFSADDIAVAGAIVDGLEKGGGDWRGDDLAHLARLWFRAHSADLLGMLERTDYGRRLIARGCAEDIADCARLDRYDLIPCFTDGSVIPEPGLAAGRT